MSAVSIREIATLLRIPDQIQNESSSTQEEKIAAVVPAIVRYVSTKPLESGRVSIQSVKRHAKLFTEIYAARGYTPIMPKPLRTPDTTLSYVNSSIAIFKEEMLSSGNVDKQFVIQSCFRHRPSDNYGYLFKMLGAFTNVAHLDDTFTVIMECLENVGLDRSQIHIVLNPEDRILNESSQRLLKDPSRLHYIDSSTEKYSVTWKFGQNELSGKGVTFVYKLPEEVPSTDINHVSYVPLGNIIIIITSAGKQYIDVGFGIECILSSFFEGNMFKIPFYELQVSYIEKEFGFSTAKARTVVKCLHPILFFLREEIAPSKKGSGYILKRLFRDLFDILDEHFKSRKEEALNMLNHIKDSFYQLYEYEEDFSSSFWEDSFKELRKQCAAFFESLNVNVYTAKRMIDKERGTLDQKSNEAYRAIFKDRLGLTNFRIETLFEQVSTEILNRSFYHESISTTR